MPGNMKKRRRRKRLSKIVNKHGRQYLSPTASRMKMEVFDLMKLVLKTENQDTEKVSILKIMFKYCHWDKIAWT